KGLHHAFQRRHEMLHEMLDSTRAAAQVPLQALAHHAPAKPGPKADGGVGIFYAQDSLLDHVKHLAVERGLESVRYMPRKLLLQMDRPLADRSVEADCSLNRVRRGLAAANDLDQRYDVRRIEWMSDDHPLRVFALRLNDTWRDPRRARSEKGINRDNLIHLCVELRLEIRSFGRVFLDKIGL